MKLLYCKECDDIILLTPEIRECRCKRCAGFYRDEINAVYSGPGVCLGFTNVSFINAVKNQPDTGMGKDFVAFVIPKEVDTIDKVEDAVNEYAKTW